MEAQQLSKTANGNPVTAEARDPKGPGKVAYSITERGGRSFWTRIGRGFVNRDGSITVKLDAVPVSGTMQLRDPEPREEGPGRHEAPAELPF